MSRLAVLIALLSLAPVAAAQPAVRLGADLVNRYVWRGIDYGDGVAVQPTLAVAFGSLEVGTWASYGIGRMGDGPSFAEMDFYVTVTEGDVSFGVTDYTYPILNDSETSDLFNVADDYNGAHTLEAFVHVTPKAVPLRLLVATAVYNAPDVPTYAEIGTHFDLGGLAWTAAAGTAFALAPPVGTSGSPFYGTTENVALIHLSLGVEKEIPLSSTFSLPVSGSLIVNPDSERSYLVFRIRL